MPFLTDAAGVAAALGGKKMGKIYKCRCPAHDDHDPSLDVEDGRDGKVLVNCRSKKCAQKDILAKLEHLGVYDPGKGTNGQYRPKAKPNGNGHHAPGPKLEANGEPPDDEDEDEGGEEAHIRGAEKVYEYLDENRLVRFRSVRWPGKKFGQHRLIKGKWLKGLSDRTKPFPFHLPELLDTPEGSYVFIPEGEKDVLNLARLGLSATCNPMGAGKWQIHYGRHLAGRHVVIIADNDEPGRNHVRDVAASCKKHRALSIVIVHAREHLGIEKPGGDVSDWIEAGGTKARLWQIIKNVPNEYRWELPAERPKLRIKGGTLADNASDCEVILGKETRRNNFTGTYRSGVALVRPARIIEKSEANQPAGSLLLRPINANYLRRYLTDLVEFEKYDERDSEWREADCTEALAKAIMEGLPWEPIPGLNGTVEAPTLRPDGTLLDKPGYDEASGLLFDPCGVSFPKIKPNPDKFDALVALETLEAPFSEFPFDDATSKSVFLAAILTAVVRRSLRSAPMFGFNAPTPGTGKTLLAECVSYIATGRAPTTMSPLDDPDEERKRLLSVLMDGTPILLIDNIEKDMRSATLCTIVTQPWWSDRILGGNEKAIVPTNMLILLSGNNLTPAGDLTRRALIATLNAGMENPEERKFEGDLHETVLALRPQLVAAALTIILACLNSGDPAPDVVSYGSFEQWQGWCRFPLIWLGRPDPYAAKAKLEGRDADRAQLGTLLSAWYEVFGDEPQTVATVVRTLVDLTEENRKLQKYIDLDEALAKWRKGRDINTVALGNYIGKRVDVPRGKLHFEAAGIEHKVSMWRAVKREIP